MVKKRGCEHRCPVCGSSALPLDGFPTYGPHKGQEVDVPWRVERGRIAHKCQDAKHRFDVDINTGTPFPEYQYKVETGGPILSALAGAPRKYPPKVVA
jgi:hypothetical protein